jgi:hypothetical protein
MHVHGCEHNGDECMQLYSFKMLPPNSMGYEDMKLCPGLRKQDLKPVDERYKFLFILGAQKAGTTWLHSALERHPIFIQADSGYMCVAYYAALRWYRWREIDHQPDFIVS